MSFVHFETIEDLNKALSEINRVLKKDGIFHIAVKAQRGEKQTDVVDDIDSGHKRFFRYYRLKQMQELLEENGFEIIDLKQQNEAEMEDTLKRSDVDLIIGLARKK